MIRTHSTLLAICLLVIALLVGACDRELKTVVLEPDSNRFIKVLANADDAGDMPDGPAGIPCPAACFYSHGLSCAPPAGAADSTLVGFKHRYEDGTAPCRCWWYVNCAYRGHVGFDLGSLPSDAGIVSAVLRWQPSTARWSGGSASNTGNCIRTMYRATEPWRSDELTAGEALSFTFPAIDQPAPTEVDVSTTIRGWHTGTLPNHGFFFTGPNESLTVRDNNRCLTTLENLRLEVVISVPKGT